MLVNSFFLRSENITESSGWRRYVTSFSVTQVQEAGHPQEIERTEEEGRKLLADLVKWRKLRFHQPSEKPSEFEVAFTIQSLIFSEINGVAGFLLVSTWADARESRAIHRKNCQNLYVTFPDTYAVFLPGGEVTGRCWRPVRSSAL